MTRDETTTGALPEAAFSLCVKGRLGGHEAQLTIRGQSYGEFAANVAAVRGLLDPVAAAPAGAAAPAIVASGPSPEGWCLVHSTQMKLNNNERGRWWSHKTADGGWCKGKSEDGGALSSPATVSGADATPLMSRPDRRPPQRRAKHRRGKTTMPTPPKQSLEQMMYEMVASGNTSRTFYPEWRDLPPAEREAWTANIDANLESLVERAQDRLQELKERREEERRRARRL